MSEQKILEFRDRAERLVTPADPGLLLRRGHALRRRRRLAPVLALAVCGAIGIGIATYAADGGGAGSNIQPAAPTPVPATTSIDSSSGHLPPGTYSLDQVPPDGRADLTVDLVGENWIGWSGGAQKHDLDGGVSWGIQAYDDTIIDQCSDRHATTLEGAIRQLSELPGRVTQAAQPDSALGLTGTHLQLSVPVKVDCGGGEPGGGYLMAIWDGPPDPRVTVDVWLVEVEDRLLILTKGVRGNPPAAMLDSLDRTLQTLRLVPPQ